MPTTIVKGPDGKRYSVNHPPGASREEIIAYAKKQASSSPQEPVAKTNGLRSDPAGIVDAGLSMASSMIAEPVAGLAGLASAPFMGVDNAVENISSVRDALTYEPRTQQGKQNLETVGGLLAPIGELFESASKGAGDAGYEALGESPLAGALGAALPEAAASIIPGGIAMRQARAAAEAAARAERISPALLDQEGSAGSAGVSQARQNAALAEDLEQPIRLTQGQATRNAEQMSTEYNLPRQSPEVGAPLANHMRQQQQDLYKNLEIQRDSLDRADVDVENDIEFGQRVKRALENRRAQNKEKTQGLYDKAEELGDLSQLVKIDELGPAFKSLFDRPNNFDVFQPTEMKMLTKLAEKTGVLSGKPISIRNAEEFRQGINAVLNDPLNPNHKKMATPLKAAVDAALDNAPEAASAYKRARAAYSRNKTEWDGNRLVTDLTGKKGRSQSASTADENVYKKMQSASVDDVRKVMKMAVKAGDVNLIHGLGQRVMVDLFKVATKADGQFNSSAFSKKLRELDQSGKLEAIYGKQRADELRKIAEVGEMINTMPYGHAANFSQSGNTLMKSAMDIVSRIPIAGSSFIGRGLKSMGDSDQARKIKQMEEGRVKQALDLEGLLSYE